MYQFTAGYKHEQFYRAERLFQSFIDTEAEHPQTVLPRGSGSATLVSTRVCVLTEPRGPDKTQRASQDPVRSEPRVGQTRPSEVGAQRARQDPAWSEPRGSDKTQRGQSSEGQTRPSEVRALRARTCATAQRPECQQASVPRNPTLPCLLFQAAGVTFQLPREGRRACLSVVCSLLLFSLLSFFRSGFPGVV